MVSVLKPPRECVHCGAVDAEVEAHGDTFCGECGVLKEIACRASDIDFPPAEPRPTLSATGFKIDEDKGIR